MAANFVADRTVQSVAMDEGLDRVLDGVDDLPVDVLDVDDAAVTRGQINSSRTVTLFIPATICIRTAGKEDEE